jgi:hypothetical protein
MKKIITKLKSFPFPGSGSGCTFKEQDKMPYIATKQGLISIPLMMD